jgi:ABC-2 type transport system permease protein
VTASRAPEPPRLRYPVFETAPPTISRRIRRIVEYRELLSSLTRKEVKVRYKDSILGFVWTLLNPLLYLIVFSLVFGAFLRANVPFYGLFMLSGLLAWNLFANGLGGATTSITGNASLVQKVWFPREILPLSAMGSALITFFFQLTVLVMALMALQRAPEWKMLPLLVPALGVVLLWGTALGIALSALNVLYRDVQHFLELLLLAWFWLTPIVYQYDFIGDTLVERFGTDRVAMANPLVPAILVFQRVIYNPTHSLGTEAAGGFDLMYRPASWYVLNLAVSGLVAVIVLLVGLRIFSRLEADLGEEL